MIGTNTRGDAHAQDDAQSVSAPGSPLRTILLLLVAAACLLGAWRLGSQATRERQLHDFLTSVHTRLKPALIREDHAATKRMNPAALAAALADPAFATDFRAAHLPPPADALDPLEPVFAQELDRGLASFDDIPRAHRLRAFYLAERGHSMFAGKSLLRQATSAMLEQVAAAPLDGLAQFELALSASALADREDDVGEPARLARAERLRTAADASMQRAVRLSRGSSTFGVPFYSTFYVNIQAGSFFMARARDRHSRGQEAPAQEQLQLALTAFSQALQFDSAPPHIDHVIEALLGSPDASPTLVASWQQLETLFQKVPPSPKPRLALLLLSRSAPSDTIRSLLASVASDPRATSRDRGSANYVALKFALRSKDVPAARARLRDVVISSPTRESDTMGALGEFQRHGHTAAFYDVVSELLGEVRDFPLLRLAAGQAAVQLGHEEDGVTQLEAFLASAETHVVTQAQRRKAQTLVARVHGSARRWGAAVAHYRALWDEDSSDRTVGAEYAEALLGHGDPTAARQLVRQLLGRWPSDPRLLALSRKLGQ